MPTFDSYALAAPILRALKARGYETPTPVQHAAIVPAIAGRDVLAVAQTGTGKTAAFLLPTIHRLLRADANTRPKGYNGPRALVLTPTRELASQIAEAFDAYAGQTALRSTVVVGGVSQLKQERALARGVDLLVATPGRLQDLMDQRIVDLRLVETLVLDEADRMLDMGFIQPIREIAAALPSPRQTLMFSATMPRAIEDLARSLLVEPERIEVEKRKETAGLIEQMVYPVTKALKPALLKHLLSDESVERAIVFTRTKHGADRVMRRLRDAGFDADAIHGDRTQRQRDRALDGFRTGYYRVLVATDVAARGIDVDGVTHVFNFDLPDDPESYVHRIGRTGRAGATGVAIAFCDPNERGLLKAVEKEIGARVPMRELPPRSPDAVAREREAKAAERAEARAERQQHAAPPVHDHAPAKRDERAAPGKPKKKAKVRGGKKPHAGKPSGAKVGGPKPRKKTGKAKWSNKGHRASKPR
ncbi:MAG: DEAD/DEAH box helicase [Phycisphaerales bacterium]